MKFGIESEKFLFNLEENRPSKGVFRFIDAISEFSLSQNTDASQWITNEFVLNMVELGTRPSHRPMRVLKDYLSHYLLIQSVALREAVGLVPLGALPMDYQPHMLPKWAYYVQNSILDSSKQQSWMMGEASPLRAAGNCAGIHVHAEVETPPEFLFSNRELQDKFNLGLMLTPMIAFSSSPYFFGKHEANSMRALRYYNGVYKKFPLHGALPGVMESSQDILLWIQACTEAWVTRGVRLGFNEADLRKLILKKGANWSPIRWNKQWNTIEIRCLDSDRIDLDCSKFIWMSGALKRMDIKGEALQCEVIRYKKLDKKVIEECFAVSGGRVRILDTEGIHEIFNRAVIFGTKDDLVEQYLYRLEDFASANLEPENKWAYHILEKVLSSHQTSSEVALKFNAGKSKITESRSIDLVKNMMDEQKTVIRAVKRFVPDIFQSLEERLPRV